MNPWLIAAPVAAAAGLTAYGAAYPRSQFFGPTICHTDSARDLALTFDDGPNPSITPQLLDLLARHNAKATFFVVGKFVREFPSLVKETTAQGHVLGNHTDTHPNLFFSSPSETHDELARCTDAILQATWERPLWFRPPFGFRSPWLGEIVHHHGMRTVMWTLIPGDWRDKPADWLIRRMKPIADHAHPLAQQKIATASRQSHGDILCLHDGYYLHPNGDRVRTLAALGHWLPRWRDLGLKFVTINELSRKVVEA